MKKKIFLWKVLGTAVLLVLASFAGFYLYRTVASRGGADSSVSGGYYVSEQPVTLIAFDFGAKNWSQYSYVRNLVGGGNVGNITANGFVWVPGVGVNAKNMSMSMVSVGSSSGVYFPEIADIDWVMNKSQQTGDNLTLVFGKDNYLVMTFKQVFDGENTTQLYNISLNTTTGMVYVAFAGNTSQNVTSNKVYYNLIVDKRTGLVSLTARDATNCSKKDTIYTTTVTPFEYANYSGKVFFNATSVKGVILEKLGVHQNPMSGPYEFLTEEHCKGNFVNP